MFKRLLLMCAAIAIIAASSTAMAGYPYRFGYRSYYAPAPVVRHYVAPRVYSYRAPYSGYYAPYSSFYYGAPAARSYYAPPYVPAPSYAVPYGGGVSVGAPGVSVRIGF